jgi:hypothetical protein
VHRCVQFGRDDFPAALDLTDRLFSQTRMSIPFAEVAETLLVPRGMASCPDAMGVD